MLYKGAYTINILPAGYIAYSLSSAEVFQNHLPECQAVWIQIRRDVFPCLTLVQTVCKCYNVSAETTLVIYTGPNFGIDPCRAELYVLTL